MADKFAYIYQKCLRSDFVGLIDTFHAQGIFLANPHSGYITALTEEGDQFIVSREWLISQIVAKKSVSFQWWLDDSIDLYCRLRFPNHLNVKEFSLDGLGERIAIVNDILIGQFENEVRAGIAKGIVIDNSGVTEEYDWDNFFMDAGSFDGPFPDVLGVKIRDLERVKAEAGSVQTETIENFVILRRI